MLHIIKTFNNTIVIYTEKKRTAQSIGESAYSFQPTFWFLFFKHYFKIVCCTFAYQAIYIHLL